MFYCLGVASKLGYQVVNSTRYPHLRQRNSQPPMQLSPEHRKNNPNYAVTRKISYPVYPVGKDNRDGRETKRDQCPESKDAYVMNLI